MPPIESTAKPLGCAMKQQPHLSVSIYHFNPALQAYPTLDVK
jgi:hypothetical protein